MSAADEVEDNISPEEVLQKRIRLSVWTFLVMQYFCIENSDGVKRMTLTAYVLRIALD